MLIFMNEPNHTYHLGSQGLFFISKSNSLSIYFALESNKSQPQTMAKAIIEEKILFHRAVSVKYLSIQKGINNTTKYQ